MLLDLGLRVSGDLKAKMQSRPVRGGGHSWLATSRVDAHVDGLGLLGRAQRLRNVGVSLTAGSVLHGCREGNSKARTWQQYNLNAFDPADTSN
jgi:hypothetical protein